MLKMFAHQMTSSAMSIGQMNSPYSRPWLWPVRRPITPSRNMRFQAQAHDDPEPLAPHPARADQAREHVEERAEVHHRQPGEDHAVHVRGTDAAEREPRDPAEGLRRDELGREHEAEEVDDGQPDDRARGASASRRRRGTAARPSRRVASAGPRARCLGRPSVRSATRGDRYGAPGGTCR